MGHLEQLSCRCLLPGCVYKRGVVTGVELVPIGEEEATRGQLGNAKQKQEQQKDVI